MRINVLGILFLLFVTSACTNKTTYFANLDVEQMSGKIDVGDYELRIAPDDMLSITVSSVVPDAAAPYNLPAVSYSEPGKSELTIVPNLQVYTVSRDGDIYFPTVGRIHVEGMTRNELAKYIEDKIRPELEDPFVLVQFMNFKVVVLGEVKNPGQIPVQTERVSILDAIGAAGDLTVYGERENVLLIREENGKRIYHRFNLSDVSIFESPYFYLRQNDVVYVMPNKAQQKNSNYNQFSQYRISIVSTVVSAVSVLTSLAIALFIR
ncbi:MAG TPA: polysaccharide export protein [Candidatus Barnesiella excrementigallinarum]|nr:polysaccharide export protein [Candidatus Barnesiella excrementigallinarum]